MERGITDLTNGKILPCLLKLSLPIMAGSFIQMAYSLINMVWVGHLGSKSVAAVGSVGLLMWFATSAAYLTKVGAEVSISHAIGRKSYKEAVVLASHTTTISLIEGILLMFFFYAGAGFILSFFRLEKTIWFHASVFLRVICFSLPFQFLNLNFSGIYNASGRSRIPFAITAGGLFCNMLLDPLFIFLFGFGFYGAAVSTIISQVLVASVFTFRLKSGKGMLDAFPFWIFPRKKESLRILRLGFPVAIMNMFYSIINMCLARTASVYGGYTGITSQTTGGQIEGVTWNTSQGVSTALGAFVSMNYGAGKTGRIKEAYRSTLRIMTVFGIFVSAALILFGKNIFGLFIPETKAMLAGGNYLRIMGYSQLFMMFELTSQGMFNGIGKTLPPSIISISLNAMRIPLAVILAACMGISGVWWAISVSSILKGMALPLWFLYEYRKKFRRLPSK